MRSSFANRPVSTGQLPAARILFPDIPDFQFGLFAGGNRLSSGRSRFLLPWLWQSPGNRSLR